MPNFCLHEMSWPEVAELLNRTDLVIVPTGAIEAYGTHLPIGSDSIVAVKVAQRIAEETQVAVAPLLPVGHSEPLLSFPGTLSLRTESLTMLMEDVCRCLIKHGFRRILFLNTHLGNVHCISTVAENLKKTGTVFAQIDWWRFLARIMPFEEDAERIPHGHASDVGTSVLLALQPDLVRMNYAKKEIPKPSVYTEYPWAITYPDLEGISVSGVIGDPSEASSEKGERIIQEAMKHLIKFVEDFKNVKLPIRDGSLIEPRSGERARNVEQEE